MKIFPSLIYLHTGANSCKIIESAEFHNYLVKVITIDYLLILHSSYNLIYCTHPVQQTIEFYCTTSIHFNGVKFYLKIKTVEINLKLFQVMTLIFTGQRSLFFIAFFRFLLKPSKLNCLRLY